jgi:hypothetical protein
MTDLAKLEAYVAISELKARYCRTLDSKDWAGYADVFTEDLELDTRPAGGTITHSRDEALKIVRRSIETAATAHQVHGLELTLNGDEADGVWALQDRVVYQPAERPQVKQADGSIKRLASLTGYGQYHEHYVRQDGRWRIARQTLSRFHVDYHFDEA